jgi:WhiB family redox-sensing transcriptional regulator
MTDTINVEYSMNPHDDKNWWAKAACKGVDPALFITDVNPETGRPAVTPADLAAAKAYCDGCPVAGPCLDHALAKREPGIWAGTTGNDRRKMSVAAYHANRANN